MVQGTQWIVGPPNNMVCSLRRKLTTVEDVQSFYVTLEQTLSRHEQKSQSVQLAFEDFDISQTPITPDQLEAFVELFIGKSVQVQRLRLFGCSALNDEACIHIARWLEQCTPETAPWELHLSDCAITTDGFSALIASMEANLNSAFPTRLRSRPRPIALYLRLSNNYINPDAIKAKIDEGVMGQFSKRSPGSIPHTAKARLVVSRIGDFEQKEGEPPAPEDAPPPKEISWEWDPSKKFAWSGGRQQDSWGHKGGWPGGFDSMWPSWAAEWGDWRDWGSTGGGWSSGTKGASKGTTKDATKKNSMDAGKGGGCGGKVGKSGASGGADSGNKSGASGSKASDGWASKDATQTSGGGQVGWQGPAKFAKVGDGSKGQAGKVGAGSTATPQVQAIKPIVRPLATKVFTPFGKTTSMGSAKTITSTAASTTVSGRPGTGVATAANTSTQRADDAKAKVGTAAARAADRSRTPPAPAPKKDGLPPGWEEHWSDEYQIPFYWNEHTGESLWEKPAA